MGEKQSSRGFRVIIVGGGVAGLTLANALQHAGLDYLVIEGRDEVAPQLGASLGLAPNGCRILDQLGCYDGLEKQIEPLTSAGNHNASGHDLMPRYDGFKLLQTRMSYPLCFLDRQLVLRSLADQINDHSKILLGKRLQKVEHTEDKVTVYCLDGSKYDGDVIVGADGTFSKTRQEMWRAADLSEPGRISQKDQESMTAEYKCCYGISSSVPGLGPGNYDITYSKDVSTMVITGKGGRVFWFLFSKMDKIYKTGNIPRFTQKDAENLAQQHLNLGILPRGSIKFGDVWNNREMCTLIALEEADFDHWTWGRFACIGDSVHKVTPNNGTGAMAAIETAAALANTLYDMSKNKAGNSSFDEVKIALSRYQRNRRARASRANKAANEVTRLQALKGMKERILTSYIVPLAGDLIVDVACDGWIGATLLKFLPPPSRSLTGTMPFNPDQGISKKDSKLWRSFIGLPLLGTFVLSIVVLLSVIPFETGEPIIQAGMITWGESNSFEFFKKFYHIGWLDEYIRGPAIVFSQSTFGIDKPSQWQNFTFFPDINVIWTIILLEASRRANVLTPIQYPFLIGMAAIQGIGIFAPLWYFLHYIFSPVSNFAASDMRLTSRKYSLAIFPIVLFGMYAPWLLAFLPSDLNLRHAGIWIWHLWPVWSSVGHWLLARTVMPDTVSHDRLYNPTRDLWNIRITIGLFSTISAAVWIYTLVDCPYPLDLVYYPYHYDLDKFIGGARALLQWDQIFFVIGSLMWILYLFADLKGAGMVRQSWLLLLPLLAASTALLGAGATTGLAWLWREEVLASRRHKSAVIPTGAVWSGDAKMYQNGHTNGYANGHANGKANGKA